MRIPTGGRRPAPLPARLHRVPDGVEYCGPVALAAVTGLPASTWPDAPMTLRQVKAALRALRADGWTVERYSGVAMGRRLTAFGLAEHRRGPADFPLAGAWFVWLDDRSGEPPHAAAVGLGRGGFRGYNRELVDTANRDPVPMTFIARDPLYRVLRVQAAWRISRAGP